jgi:hypothetical protein
MSFSTQIQMCKYIDYIDPLYSLVLAVSDVSNTGTQILLFNDFFLVYIFKLCQL